VTNFVKKVHSVEQAQANDDGEASKRNKNHRVVLEFLPQVHGVTSIRLMKAV
jgi:hypothetical protein